MGRVRGTTPKLALGATDLRAALASGATAHHSFPMPRSRQLRAAAVLPLLVATACGGVAPASSLVAGHLAPCPPKPHCVSTSAAEPPDRRMPPVPFTDLPASAHQRILSAMGHERRARVVVDSGGYTRLAVHTLVFRFVDDVEFIVDSVSRNIEFRSSARLGFNDWGVNRDRMDRVVARLRR